MEPTLLSMDFVFRLAHHPILIFFEYWQNNFLILIPYNYRV